MGLSQREKGKVGEREAANTLSDLLGTHLFRNLGQERDGGSDITVPSTAGDLAVQVKRQERARIGPWLRQARDDVNGSDAIPCVMWRANGKGWCVVMEVEEWAKLVRECQ